MGSSASIVNEGNCPDEFQVLLDLVDKQKFKISEADALVINKERTKVFKKHTAIIDCLTSRTKNQLRKMYGSSKSNPDDIYKLIGTKDTYAKFISLLFTSKEQIEFEFIMETTKGEYEEELFINIISTSTNKEIKKLNDLYTAEKLHSLGDIIETKTKKDSSIQKFFLMIMKCDRDESTKVDLELADHQADIIHHAGKHWQYDRYLRGLWRLLLLVYAYVVLDVSVNLLYHIVSKGAARLIGADEDAIFEILAKVSRAQCVAINEAYERLFKMKLERAINMKFKGE